MILIDIGELFGALRIASPMVIGPYFSPRFKMVVSFFSEVNGKDIPSPIKKFEDWCHMVFFSKFQSEQKGGTRFQKLTPRQGVSFQHSYFEPILGKMFFQFTKENC